MTSRETGGYLLPNLRVTGSNPVGVANEIERLALFRVEL